MVINSPSFTTTAGAGTTRRPAPAEQDPIDRFDPRGFINGAMLGGFISAVSAVDISLSGALRTGVGGFGGAVAGGVAGAVLFGLTGAALGAVAGDRRDVVRAALFGALCGAAGGALGLPGVALGLIGGGIAGALS